MSHFPAQSHSRQLDHASVNRVQVSGAVARSDRVASASSESQKSDFGHDWDEVVDDDFSSYRTKSTSVETKNTMDSDDLTDFRQLSSTKQNVELFKILKAIAAEIQNLSDSTERRFKELEAVTRKLEVTKQQHQEPPKVPLRRRQRVQSAGGNIQQQQPQRQWEKVKNTRSFIQHKGSSSLTRTASHNPAGARGSLGSETAEVENLSSQTSSWPHIGDLDELLNRNRTADKVVVLNVGGTKFEATWGLLERLPQTRLGKLRSCRSEEEILKLCDGFDPDNNEYYFNRQPRNFNCVLSFLNTGKLHLGEETCVIAFSQDMEYWGVDDLYLEPCCVQRYYQQRELLNWDHQAKKEEEEEVFREGRIGKLQKILWDLFEKPHTSLGARIVAIVSITFIIISTVVLTLNTLPYFSNRDSGDHEKDYPPFALLEAIYMSWFTFEFVVRLISCPSKVKFIKSLMNIIDLLAILPYFASIALVNSTDIGQLTEVRRIAQFFRIMRILRIFKLARHSVGLQSLGFTLKNSYKELGLLMLFLTMGVLIFSSLAYVFEKDHKNSSFSTMMDAYWWALITMTTVGYGDISPTSGLGKVIGSCCAICGVLVIALPIPIIGNNFAAFYKNERRREQLAEKKLAIERARRKGAIQPFPGQTGLPYDDHEFDDHGGGGGGDDDDDDDNGENNKVRMMTQQQSVDITELDAESLRISQDNNTNNKTFEMSFLKSTSGFMNGLTAGLYSGNKNNSDKSMTTVAVK